MNTSVIVPTYNEVNSITACLQSLTVQTKSVEIIVVDDGSTDDTTKKVKLFKKVQLLTQKHLGPAAARNFGAQKATGDILVFVDADMTFAPNFIDMLTDPIEKSKSPGTFTKEEYVANWNNVWARCWNYNQGLYSNRRIAENYPEIAPVFRAILKKEFDQVGGFTPGVGWTDDWSLSRKLLYQATATHARCYHTNPASLSEVFKQARWIGKNEFLSGNFMLILINLIRFSWPLALITGIWKSLITKTPQFLIFKLVYNSSISLSLETCFFNKDRNK